MLKKTLLGITVMLCAAGVGAQDLPTLGAPWDLDMGLIDGPAPGNRAPQADGFDFELEAMGRGGGVTEETVGDPDSFGRNVKYLGMKVIRTYLRDDCSVIPPEAGPCIELPPAPDVVTVDESDLATIVLPGKSTNSILCFAFTPFATWEWYNDTGVQQMGRMGLRPSFRIESEVLDDPALIDPGTGMPFGGVLTESTVTTFYQIRTLDPGELDYQHQSMTRSCTAGLVSKQLMKDAFGLSDKVITDFFKNPITVSFGVSGTASMMTYASYRVGIRLYGD